jgi:hypothetical protein
LLTAAGTFGSKPPVKRVTRVLIERPPAVAPGATPWACSRWLSQLEELAALTWPVPDEELLDSWAASEPLADVLRRVVELLALLARLPDQPILIPPPRQWNRAGRRGGAPTGVSTVGDGRVLARVRALLAKAESTESPWRMTTAWTVSPHVSWGTPITATSLTPG